MNDPQELNRVALIHEALDHAAATQHLASQHPGYEHQPLEITVDGVTMTYTAEEVRKWPSIRDGLRLRLVSLTGSAAVYIPGYTMSGIKDVAGFGAEDIAHRILNSGDSIDRGLILYRAMLTEPKRDTIPVPTFAFDPDHPSPVLIPDSRPAELFDGRIHSVSVNDPYQGHDIAADKLVAARTYELPENVRARRVATLRAELDRPMPFPAEGRQDRALPRSNQR